MDARLKAEAMQLLDELNTARGPQGLPAWIPRARTLLTFAAMMEMPKSLTTPTPEATLASGVLRPEKGG